MGKVLSKLNFTETIFLFSLIPVCLHLISLAVLKASGAIIKFDLLLNILAGKIDVLISRENEVFHDDLYCFLVYTMAEVIVGILLGIVIAWILLRHRWMVQALMRNNIWYNLFTGLSSFANKKQQIDSVHVEVVALSKDAVVVYAGLLKYYEVSGDSGSLSLITLQNARRQDLVKNRKTGVISRIPCDALTIFGKDIINVNVTYMQLIADPGNPLKQKLSPLL